MMFYFKLSFVGLNRKIQLLPLLFSAMKVFSFLSKPSEYIIIRRGGHKEYLDIRRKLETYPVLVPHDEKTCLFLHKIPFYYLHRVPEPSIREFIIELQDLQEDL